MLKVKEYTIKGKAISVYLCLPSQWDQVLNKVFLGANSSFKRRPYFVRALTFREVNRKLFPCKNGKKSCWWVMHH